MSNTFLMQDFEKSVKQTIMDATKKVIDEKIEQMKKDIETQIRSETGAICARVMTFFNFRMNENEMVITVDFKNINK